MNTGDSSKQTVNIPVKIEKGQIKYLYGSNLPEIKDGAEGNLIILQNEIIDKDFACKIQNERKEKLFEKGERLLIAVNINYIPPEKWGNTIIEDNIFPHVPFRFIEIILETPLYLLLRGTKKSTLSDGECKITVLKDNAKSINSAYAKISETYETKRTSHTANVFNKCFYFNKEAEYWAELDTLREKIESQYQSELHVEDDNKIFDNNYIVGLNLSDVEIKLIKYIETFGDMPIEKMKAMFSTSEELYSTIRKLTNKRIISKMNR